jgi:hypothetical protein
MGSALQPVKKNVNYLVVSLLMILIVNTLMMNWVVVHILVWSEVLVV